jgi:hypothetical protein
MALLPGFRKILHTVFIYFLGILINSPFYAQTINNSVNPNEQNFLVRTKQFNEFISRFNYKINFNGDPVDSVFRTKIPRDKIISSLFDMRDPRVDPSGKNYSNDYVREKSEFISEVISKNELIYRYSGKIIAEAKSRILFNGVPKEIVIYLTQETVGKDMVKWVISSVNGEFFNFLQTDSNYVRFIPPSSNETDFMNLKRALEDVNYLQYYTSKDYKPDYLTLFYYMLNSSLVKFDYVEEVNYSIIDLPGWCFRVKEFNRNEMNSGWLIYDLKKNNLDLKDYIKSLGQ